MCWKGRIICLLHQESFYPTAKLRKSVLNLAKFEKKDKFGDFQALFEVFYRHLSTKMTPELNSLTSIPSYKLLLRPNLRLRKQLKCVFLEAPFFGEFCIFADIIFRLLHFFTYTIGHNYCSYWRISYFWWVYEISGQYLAAQRFPVGMNVSHSGSVSLTFNAWEVGIFVWSSLANNLSQGSQTLYNDRYAYGDQMGWWQNLIIGRDGNETTRYIFGFR